MQTFRELVRQVPALLRSYITPHILRDIHQFVVLSAKRLTHKFPLEVHLTEHCNLNCIGCTHFSPLASPEFLSPETFERDLSRISVLTKGGKHLYEFKMLGGEPLLHPEIEKFLEISRRYLPKARIQVTTNGILLPKMPETFWKACHSHKIHLSISHYPIKLDKPEIKRLALHHHVAVEYNGSDAPDRMLKMPLDPEGRADPKTTWKNCMITWGCCVTLRDGRIYTCMMPAHIRFFNKYFNKHLDVTENDFIDIQKASSIKEIINFLEKPFPFCRYCRPKDMQYGIKWAISEKKITEWT
jgi:MoaA/NifB/PqqE/SkfB family radical SAM enzyme